MTYFSSQRGAGLANTIQAIRERESFKSSGALCAETPTRVGDHPWWSAGHLPGDDLLTLRTEQPSYVVYSYATPIGWWSEKFGWTIPDVKHSATTSRHQSVLRRAALFAY